ncbi:hypothetical protein BCR44DRAFT_48559 [Catenaria anguillulae PL171]|uniref:Sugar phosphate phosphatase n=1 Tax=Catenaria anguillulae PL171 TaxID=765915 RepID=A0A1Y2HWC1_9FUNG|nr:hypothetical protein BCR44DRAFT_48559 [Catenaria anguillulae PL171]
MNAERTPLIHPPRAPLAGKHHGSFAFYTIRDRLPVILTRVINDVNQAVFKLDHERLPDHHTEGKAVIEALAGLRYQMQRDHPMRPLQDSMPDVEAWNGYLAAYHPEGVGHFQAPWLTQECYVYRRIREAFAMTKHWQAYDPFLAEKTSSLEKSIPVLVKVAQHVDRQSREVAHWDIVCQELMLFSLWGNAVDLSLLAGQDTMDTEGLGKKMIEEGRAGVVVDDLDAAVKDLVAMRGARVDFVLDNAGFELTADLFLASWLVATGIAQTVVFHIKAYPWFVSDTTQADFDATLATLEPHLPTHVASWRALLASGAWQVRSDPFWTYPHAFHHLPRYPIASELRKSDFIVFKGDLNYRKLVFDCKWDVTTPFVEAIGPLRDGGADGLGQFLSLRTCKSDVCVGLSEEKAMEMEAVDGWMTSGKHAVISYKR